MRTSIAWGWAAVVGMMLTGCAAQNAVEGPDLTPTFEEPAFTNTTRVTTKPGPKCPVYPPQALVAVNPCPASHPYYRKAKTMLVGPVPSAEFDVSLAPHCPALGNKATVTVKRVPSTTKYFLGSRMLDRSARLVLEPGRHCLYLLVQGEMVKVAEVILEADTDYFACLAEI